MKTVCIWFGQIGLTVLVKSKQLHIFYHILIQMLLHSLIKKYFCLF